MRRAVMAIDPSLAGTAVAVSLLDGVVLKTIKSAPASEVHARLARYDSIVTPIEAMSARYAPALCLIEGYSFGSPKTGGRGQIDRAELGGILRWRLSATTRLLEVPPSTLKKFATGKGNASKAQVVSAIAKRYDRTFATDDEADAFALLQLGLCLVGQAEPENQAQRLVVEGLRAGMERAA